MNEKGFSSLIGSPKDLAHKIDIFDVKTFMTVIILSYKQLLKTQIINEKWEEDQITLELFVKINTNTLNRELEEIPIHQYPIYPKQQRGKPPTIDFVFRKGFREIRYLGFECKILNEKKKSLFDEYIDEGIMRFITGKYSHDENQGGMLAYILNGDPNECLEVINNKLHNKYGFKEGNLLIKEPKIDDFENIFKSFHKRDIKNINIFHLFLKF